MKLRLPNALIAALLGAFTTPVVHAGSWAADGGTGGHAYYYVARGETQIDSLTAPNGTNSVPVTNPGSVNDNYATIGIVNQEASEVTINAFTASNNQTLMVAQNPWDGNPNISVALDTLTFEPAEDSEAEYGSGQLLVNANQTASVSTVNGTLTTVTNNGTLSLGSGVTSGAITNAGSLTLTGATTGYIQNTSGNSSIVVSGADLTTSVNGFCLSSTQNSHTAVTIESGATLHITGTAQSVTGNAGSFMLSNWPGESTVDIYGTLISEAALSGRDGSGAIVVHQGGVLEMRAGISMLAQRNTNSLTVENGGTLRAGATSTTTGNYTLTLKDGATLEGYYGSGSAVTIAQNMTLAAAEEGASSGVNLSAASGKEMTLSGVLSGTGSLKITGGGTVKLTNTNNSFSGGVNISSGSLYVTGQTISGPLSGSGTLYVNGGTSAISGDNSGFSGELKVNNAANLTVANAISAKNLAIYNNNTQATFNGAVTVTGGNRADVGYDNNAQNINVAFNQGVTYNGTNAYAFVVGNTNTLTLSGTSDFGGKKLGLSETASLTLKENATLSNIGDIYNSSNSTNNGAVTLETGSRLLYQTSQSITSNALTNNGTIELEGGSSARTLTINSSGTVVNKGTIAVQGGAAQTTLELKVRYDIEQNGKIAVRGTGAASTTLLLTSTYDNQGTAGDPTHTTNLGAVELSNGELKNNSNCESAVRNITTLTVDGSSTLSQNSWNTFWNIAAINKGTADSPRTLTWNMTANHYTNSVMSLTGAGTFDGTFVANRTNANGNGNYQAYLEIAHQDALQNAVLNATGTGSSYMTVALKANKVNLSGLQGNANSILIAGDANKTIGSNSSKQGQVVPTSSGTSELVITSKDGANDKFAGKVLGGISITKEGTGTQSFSGEMSSFDGDIKATAGILQLLNQTSVNVENLTITGSEAHHAEVGVYTGDTKNTNSEAGIVVKGTLTANEHAVLNANLTMKNGSTIAVDHTTGGLHMGSTVTFEQGGKMNLSDNIINGLNSLTVGEGLTLFSGVDEFNINGEAYDAGTTYKAGDFFNLSNADVAVQRPYDLVVKFGDGMSQSGQSIFLWMETPEPATATLSLLALAALAARRKRK